MWPSSIRRSALAALVVLASVVPAAAASSAETIDEYRTEVEPICKVNASETQRVLSGARKEVSEGKLTLAGARFAKAHRSLSDAYRRLSAVPRPPAEAPRLGHWLSYVKSEVVLLAEVADALKAGQGNRAETFVAKLTHTANLANSQIVLYDLHYCKIEPGRYA
jgi:hypothetical protein